MSDTPDKSNDDFEFPSLHPEEETKKDTPAKAEPKPAVTPSEDKPTIKIPPEEGKSTKTFGDWYASHKPLALTLGFLLAGAAMWGVTKLRENNIDEPPANTNSSVDEVPVNVVEVRFGRFQDEIYTTGTLKGETEIELRFEVEGTIQEFSIVEGAQVRAGQLIAKLNDRDVKLKVQRAKIEAEQMEKLFMLGGISKTKRDEARLNLEVAQADLDKTRILASREGIIGDKSADVGEYVNPQRKIATLVSIKSVIVKVGVIERQLDKIYIDQKILITVDAYPGNVFEGRVASISPLVDETSKTFELTAKIPNSDSLLLPGMFVKARIVTFEADDAMSVPNDALIKSTGGFQVYVINKDNIAELRDVEVGHVATEATQILSGLQPGEVVVAHRPPELKAGSKVKIIEVQKPSF